MKKFDSYLSISKTAEKLGIQTHVLRFWEKKFFIIKPKKGSSGRRYYSSSDIESLKVIKKLLYVDGYTIKGAINFINKNYNKRSQIDQIDEDSVVIRLNKAIVLIKDGSKLIGKNII